MPGPDTSAVPLAAAGGGEGPQDGQTGRRRREAREQTAREDPRASGDKENRKG